MRALCGRCKTRPKKKHFNSKWCVQCAKELIKKPRGTLTASQRAFAIRHAGDMSRDAIAKRLGVSMSNLKRSCRDVRFYYKNGKYKERPELVRQVLGHYFANGKKATEDAFPNVNVKCIVDRPEFYGVKRVYRQTRWTTEEYREAIKMAGLVSFSAQAKYFARPGANAGSVRSLFDKRIRVAGGQLHGIPEWYAKTLVSDKCPRVRVKRLNDVAKGSRFETRSLVLWVDAEKHLLKGTPRFVRSGIKGMAEFSRWIFGRKDVRSEVLKIIRERELP